MKRLESLQTDLQCSNKIKTSTNVQIELSFSHKPCYNSAFMFISKHPKNGILSGLLCFDRNIIRPLSIYPIRWSVQRETAMCFIEIVFHINCVSLKKFGVVFRGRKHFI